MTMFWFFLQIGKIQPQKYLSMTGSVSSLMQGGGRRKKGGRKGGERRETVFLSLDLIQHLLLVFGAGSTLYTEKIGLGSGIKTSLKACIASGVPDSQAIKQPRNETSNHVTNESIFL